jgi:hypothetical protein
MRDHDPSGAQHQTELEELVRAYVASCPRTRAVFGAGLDEHSDSAALDAYDEAMGQAGPQWSKLKPIYGPERP